MNLQGTGSCMPWKTTTQGDCGETPRANTVAGGKVLNTEKN